MMLDEIALTDDDSKKKAIQKYFNHEVILNDFHEEWCHGVILTERHDNEVYQLKILDGRRQRQMHYHDLKQLIVVRK
jgi:hypothetical protein